MDHQTTAHLAVGRATTRGLQEGRATVQTVGLVSSWQFLSLMTSNCVAAIAQRRAAPSCPPSSPTSLPLRFLRIPFVALGTRASVFPEGTNGGGRVGRDGGRRHGRRCERHRRRCHQPAARRGDYRARRRATRRRGVRGAEAQQSPSRRAFFFSGGSLFVCSGRGVLAAPGAPALLGAATPLGGTHAAL